jgi:hypothetical protein
MIEVYKTKKRPINGREGINTRTYTHTHIIEFKRREHLSTMGEKKIKKNTHTENRHARHTVT